ncbi:hypothetical protein KFK09_016661 [Dendrobium nobile]|uniref:Peptidase A1 domain-containing protein n=1 Tax=Dendrobium nobile TaxID=94219 RepID=A0A8T3AYR8_DENNO|nr:hypothetical protein KFK09_016661 [Dendrobium nobile]
MTDGLVEDLADGEGRGCLADSLLRRGRGDHRLGWVGGWEGGGSRTLAFTSDELALIIGLPNRGIKFEPGTATTAGKTANDIRHDILKLDVSTPIENVREQFIVYLLSNIFFPMANFRIQSTILASTSPSRFNVVHWHGLCSTRGRQDKAFHVELLRRDQARVNYIQHRVANANDSLNPVSGSLFARVPTSIGLALGISAYIVNIGLGTPTKSFSLMFDTGSDLTWTQCVPCVHCYTQKNPFYDSTQSSSFIDIPCNSKYCTELDQFGCSSTSTCLYKVEYADYSSTNGSFIQDTLTFSSDIIQNFRFGCGHNNTGYFGQTDGLLGLGRGVVSIISQTAQLYGNVFSYCLPSGSDEIGYLELGSSVPGVKYTPMLTNPDLPSSYFVKLIGISIGGISLALSPTETMLDSGTSFSYLPPTVYSALRSIFRKKMNNYPTAPPLFNYDTCYNLTDQPEVDVPEIVLTYDGDVTTYLDGSGILDMTSLSQACLAFAKTNDDIDVAIIGNMQQRRLNIVYDVGNLRIGFGSNGCN